MEQVSDGARELTARLQCAAITRGCMSALVFPVGQNVDVHHLDMAVAVDRRAAALLVMNGWWLDHGQWVCGHHSRSGPCG
jgi:hypothetical protein